jgi:SAM-dependent methyltransferase
MFLGITRENILNMRIFKNNRNSINAAIRVRLSRVSRKFRLFVGRRFDRKYGVDTGGIVALRNLGLSSAQRKAGHGYGATPAPAIRRMLECLTLDHSKYTFVDFGSGKGRVLLLASEYPYKRIIGIEYSQYLAKIAENNIGKWNNTRQKCFDIESICIDAGNFRLPHTPLVLYFFTPFPIPVIKQVVANIRESLNNNPRPLHILYYGARQDFIDVLARLKLPCREIYSHRPIAALGKYKGFLFQSEG